MASLARLLIRIFFRGVEVEHGERITHRPTVLVANHRNGLVDGLLLMTALRRYPRFLGKSTLFRIPPLWPFLKLAGVVPVYRAKDGGRTERNTAALARARSLLAEGGMIAVFPEGISHDEPNLQPLRTGAARVALGAAVDDGIIGVETVAVGLTYDSKARFRSRALVRVGVPESVGTWDAEYRHDEHAAVRSLTEQMAERLRQISPDYVSWSQETVLAQIAEVVARNSFEALLPEDVHLAERERITDALARAEGTKDKRAGMVELRAAFDAYQRDLTLLGLTDAQVATSYQAGRLRLTLLMAVAKAVAAFPFAVIGAIIHVIPYQIVKMLAKTPGNDGMRATVKLLGCFASFTVVYALLGILFGHRYGPSAGLAAALAAPACGYIAVRLTERVKRLGGAIEGAKVAKSKGRVFESVLAHRDDVLAAAQMVLGGSRTMTPRP